MVAPPAFVRIEHRTRLQSVISIPVYTDVGDAAFVDAFAVETHWRVRAGDRDFNSHADTARCRSLATGRTQENPGVRPPGFRLNRTAVALKVRAPNGSPRPSRLVQLGTSVSDADKADGLSFIAEDIELCPADPLDP